MSDPTGATAELPLEQRLQLRQAAERLRDIFAGQLNAETIERFLTESFDQISAGARLPNWLPLLAERFAKERLRALVRLELGAEVVDARRALPLRPERRPVPDGRRVDAPPRG